MSAYVSGFTRLRTALSIELPPVILFSESNVALLFKEMFALILSQRTESLFTSLPKPSIIFFGVIIPVVRVPVLSVQIISTYANSGILPGFLARILNFSIVFTFCFVTSFTIRGNPSGTAATIIVNATEKFCAIF